jgi:high-affinity iron transporter
MAFLDGTDAAFADLKGALEERDPAAVEEIDRALVLLREEVTEAYEGREVAPDDEIQSQTDTALDTLEEIKPKEWEIGGDEADFDLIQISLDQVEAAAGAGEWDQAEQARLAAYSFLEFGPELKLKAFNPQMAIEIEALFWYGADGNAGLAQLVADHASVSEFRDTRVPLDEKLNDAQGILGEGASATTAIVNSALIVFREGLEAILIMAAITASLIGPRRRLRQPIMRGALLALPASIALFVAALTVIDSLSRYGEKLEAIVGVVAIAVLLLTLNWFFHRVYWTEWISSHRQRGKKLATGAVAAGSAAGATIAGLYLLGFTSVFREGFETVLFLQAVQLSSGTGVVIAGSALGLAATLLVGAATFALEQRLPYKKMLIVTGVLISLVLVVMVGTTVRTMQGVGWLPISPIDVEFPLWMGTWLGIFPTWETILGQFAALGFVLGTYFLAEYVRKRNIRRAVARSEDNGNGNGSGAVTLDPDAPRIEAEDRAVKR